MTETGHFYYGQDYIPYEIRRKKTIDASKHKPRKVIIKVHLDLRVVATAPIDASDALIHEAMVKRARWIWQSLQDFAKQTDQVLPKRYVSGETQFYLGRRYVLKVLPHSDPTELISSTVKLSRGKLNVLLSPKDAASDTKARAATVKKLIDDWYNTKAQSLFHERLSALRYKASWVTDTPSFKLMTMSKQWGSCSVKGHLLLNPHLIKAPKECIDYVILHELCHIAEYNHSARFWRLLTQVMPNWKAVKDKLDGMAELYLNE